MGSPTPPGSLAAAGPRYAIYAAPPPESRLWQWGAKVIGYDAANGTMLPGWHPVGISADRWSALTAEPRRYGFHGTLKAPFHLLAGASEDMFLDAVAKLAAALRPLPAARLEVAALTRYVALVPTGEQRALSLLAERVVTELDYFRAPLTEGERVRRRAAGLTPRQAELLERHGYPYVLEQFHYHMTLAGPLEADERDAVAAALRRDLDTEGGAPMIEVDELVVFRQAAPAALFRIIARAPLSPSPSVSSAQR